MHTVAEMVRMNGRRHGAREAVVDLAVRRSHRELADRAVALARGLAKQGVRPGEPVGVLAGNGAFSAEAFLGIVAAGAVFVPYNWRWSTAELVAGINESTARIVLVANNFADELAAAMATGELEQDLQAIVESGEYEQLLSPGPWVDPGIGPDDPLCVIFTGGTTGTSKGVVLSHRAAMVNALNEMADCGVGRSRDDRGLITTPMFHSAGLLCWFLPHYMSGATSVLLHRFDEEVIADIIGRERITNTFMVPNMIRRMLTAEVFLGTGFQAHFRALHSGAGLLRMRDKVAVRDVLPGVELYFRYGLTEAGPMVTRMQPADMMRDDVDGSIGLEYLMVEAQVQDESGAECPAGELGEICVRGPAVMSGYFRRPSATAEVFRDGWLRTGDLAVRDEQGYFYFRDRAKDMIKTGGENVYSAEIEQVLYTHPGVLEVAVVGVASAEWDEEVRAVVTPRPGSQLDEAGLRAFVRERLAGYKVPKKVAFVRPGELPRSPSGKFLKGALKEQLGWK